MENHVTGLSAFNNASPDLPALRCAVVAVVIDNPFFSAAEQLQTNHAVYECEDAAHLTKWADRLRHEAGRRGLVAEMQQAASNQGPAFAAHLTQQADYGQLLQSPALNIVDKDRLARFWDSRQQSLERRMTLVGYIYDLVFRRLGKMTDVVGPAVGHN